MKKCIVHLMQAKTCLNHAKYLVAKESQSEKSLVLDAREQANVLQNQIKKSRTSDQV